VRQPYSSPYSSAAPYSSASPQSSSGSSAGAASLHSPRGAYPAGPAPQAVALVDERFATWLAGQNLDASPQTLQRHTLTLVVTDLLRQHGIDLPLLRVYLYSDRPMVDALDDVVLRTVPQHHADGGLGLVRAMGLEISQLAQRGACSHLFVFSDDERLIPYVDEAQWRGTKVLLATDEAHRHVGRLMSDDPSWARLLAQADRRVVLPLAAWQALAVEGAPLPDVPARAQAPISPAGPAEAYARREEPVFFNDTDPAAPPTDDWREQVQRVIAQWWEEESPDARQDLSEEMRHAQGVPPETDRHLLLRVRRELSRTLSFPEKKAMREMIRATVLGEEGAGQRAPVSSDS